MIGRDFSKRMIRRRAVRLGLTDEQLRAELNSAIALISNRRVEQPAGFDIDDLLAVMTTPELNWVRDSLGKQLIASMRGGVRDSKYLPMRTRR